MVAAATSDVGGIGAADVVAVGVVDIGAVGATVCSVAAVAVVTNSFTPVCVADLQVEPCVN